MKIFSKNFLNSVTDEDIKKATQEIYSNVKTCWDPVISNLDLNQIKQNAGKIDAKYESLVKNPQKPKKQLYLSLVIISTIIFTIILLSFSFFPNGIIQIIFIIILLSLAPLFIYNYYRNLIIDLVKLQIAKNNNWLYDPEVNYQKWKYLSSHFPELFQIGDESQNVEDQFWGKVEKNGKTHEFYSALFRYTTVSTDSKGRKHRTVHNKHFFSIKLEKNLKTRFHLYPENVFSKIGNFFTKKEINTESIEFNKTFAFSYKGSKNENSLEIVKTLSPAVQIALLDLTKSKKGTNILFAQNCVIFMFNGNFFNKIDSNFFKEIKLSQKDQDYFMGQINSLTDISSQIIKYLD